MQAAYTAVSARRGFGVPQTMQVPSKQYLPQPVEQPKKPIREWPPAVRAYVQRSFSENHTIKGVARQELEAKLKSIISEAAENDTLLTIDWDNKPLPQQIITEERNRLLQSQQYLTNTQPSQFPLVSASPQVTKSKKRKSSEAIGSGESTPPWRASQIPLGDRITYTDKRIKFDKSNELRKKRFGDSQPSTPGFPDDEMTLGPVVGLCENLEKKYLRLTAPPKAATVRPLHVLRKTLEHLKEKWRSEKNYNWVCDQFKSLRQDLTVQHIKNDFTVNVYEIHARIALESGDMGEYNQCQTQLYALYAMKLGGHPIEFKAYRILYFIYTGSKTDMNDLIADLTTAEKNEAAIKHALDTRSALALGNYHRFFKLYLVAPGMGAYLLDMSIQRERLSALANVTKAYKPSVKLRFVTEELGFESDQEAARFICDHNAGDLLSSKDEAVHLECGGKSAQLFEALRKDPPKIQQQQQQQQ